jgi:prepilin-type N-terminal cleavage/methylation domain-containing protein
MTISATEQATMCHSRVRTKFVVTRGFTLVELLVVIAIIGILVALLLPAIQAAREAARRSQCQNNLKQFGVALHNYHDAHGALPNGAPSKYWTGIGGTWAALLLPYLEEQNVYNQLDLKKSLSDPVNKTAVTTVIATFICPSDQTAGQPLQGGKNCAGQPFNPCNSMALWYVASMGPTRDGTAPGNSCIFCPFRHPSWCCQGHDYGRGGVKDFAGAFGQNETPIKFGQISDGLSKTYLVGETIPRHCSFNGAYCSNFPIAGTSIPLNTMVENNPAVDDLWYSACGFKSEHVNGAHFCYGDGRVDFVSDAIDYFVFNAAGSRAGEEGDVPPPVVTGPRD